MRSLTCLNCCHACCQACFTAFLKAFCAKLKSQYGRDGRLANKIGQVEQFCAEVGQHLLVRPHNARCATPHTAGRYCAVNITSGSRIVTDLGLAQPLRQTEQCLLRDSSREPSASLQMENFADMCWAWHARQDHRNRFLKLEKVSLQEPGCGGGSDSAAAAGGRNQEGGCQDGGASQDINFPGGETSEFQCCCDNSTSTIGSLLFFSLTEVRLACLSSPHITP